MSKRTKRDTDVTTPRRHWFRRQPAHDRHDQSGWFGEGTQQAFALAQEEAKRLNHNYIGTEHLLLGLVRDADSLAGRVLISLGVELSKVRSAVAFIIGRGAGLVTGERVLTPRAKKVIELAMDEARRLKTQPMGTEHLLLGLVREGEGIAAGVLESMGVELERVRTQVMVAIARPGEPLPPFPPIPRRQGVAINQPRGAGGPVRANEVVYGLALPPETFTRLVAVAQRLNRPVDDLMREAIARVWLAEPLPQEPPKSSPDAPSSP